MKMQEALAVINGTCIQNTSGYMVHFEHVEGAHLVSDYFPDRHAGEPLIEDENAAWELAVAFATRTRGECINIYVVNFNFTPVLGYQHRKIKNR